MQLITLEEALQHYEAWKSAELALATGQSYSIAGRTLTRVNLGDVKSQMAFWAKKIRELEAVQMGRKVPGSQRRYVPVDT